MKSLLLALVAFCAVEANADAGVCDLCPDFAGRHLASAIYELK